MYGELRNDLTTCPFDGTKSGISTPSFTAPQNRLGQSPEQHPAQVNQCIKWMHLPDHHPLRQRGRRHWTAMGKLRSCSKTNARNGNLPSNRGMVRVPFCVIFVWMFGMDDQARQSSGSGWPWLAAVAWILPPNDAEFQGSALHIGVAVSLPRVHQRCGHLGDGETRSTDQVGLDAAMDESGQGALVNLDGRLTEGWKFFLSASRPRIRS